MGLGVSSGLDPSPSHFAVAISMQFSVAPLSKSAFSSALPCLVYRKKGTFIESLASKYTASRLSALTLADRGQASKNPHSLQGWIQA